MASNKFKFNKRILSQITLLLLGVIIIFFTYFYAGKDKTKKTVEVKEKEITEEIQNKNTFENIKYEGVDASGNQFVINSEYAEFENETPNLIDMKNILCNFYFKDGTVLKITSYFWVYDNLTNDMSFEQNVKMFYLESKLFSEKANFVNSENYLFVEGNVIAEGLEGNLKADKMNFYLKKKKLRISMYNQDKVNIKVNY